MTALAGDQDAADALTMREKMGRPKPQHTGLSGRGLASFRLASLQALREEYVAESDNGPSRETIRCLFRNARLALKRPPGDVVDEAESRPVADPQDYGHQPERARSDRARLQILFDDGISLALLALITCDDRFVEHAAWWLRWWFLDPESRRAPHLRYAQVRGGRNRNEQSERAIFEMKDYYYYLDAVRIIEEFGVLTADESLRFRQWLARYLKWLQRSPQGRAARRSATHHGIYYDLQVASIASFLNDDEAVCRALSRAKDRMPRHFSPNGVPYEEMRRTPTAHYCCLNLQGWLNMANLSRRYGEDLACHTASNGGSLQAATNWLSCHFGWPWPYARDEEFDTDRFVPLVHVARELGLVVNVPGACEEIIAKVTSERPIFHPHDGVRPYWNI